MSPLKVEVGSGKKKRPGYVTCDIRKTLESDYVCPADALPFGNNSVDEIYSRHLIEHFTLKEFLRVLSEWNRVLKTGGEIYIICPNLLWHLEQITKGKHESFYNKESGENDRYWGYGSLFGWQQDEYDIHKFGYYFELLRDILLEAGFDQIEDLTNTDRGLERAPYHLEVRAIKQKAFVDYQNHSFFSHFKVSH